MSSVVFKAHAPRPWPLSFVAQIDFAEILSAGGLEGFPTSGRLLFFCDPVLSDNGALKEEQPCAELHGKIASVMFLTGETDRLRRREFLLRQPRAAGLHVQAAPRDPQAVAAAATPRLP
jgi:hypothetical protein